MTEPLEPPEEVSKTARHNRRTAFFQGWARMYAGGGWGQFWLLVAACIMVLLAVFML